jgi:DNA/RNA-binding domain of Phe-tRNA-synthetase-like protein
MRPKKEDNFEFVDGQRDRMTTLTKRAMPVAEQRSDWKGNETSAA